MSTPNRTLLLPIPYHIADKVHQLIQTASIDQHKSGTELHLAREFQKLADQLDTLAREAGVIGW
jgi:hypothetical protein